MIKYLLWIIALLFVIFYNMWMDDIPARTKYFMLVVIVCTMVIIICSVVIVL